MIFRNATIRIQISNTYFTSGWVNGMATGETRRWAVIKWHTRCEIWFQRNFISITLFLIYFRHKIHRTASYWLCCVFFRLFAAIGLIREKKDGNDWHAVNQFGMTMSGIVKLVGMVWVVDRLKAISICY